MELTGKIPFSIRTLVLTDLDQAAELSDSVGWNQTVKDWRILIENPLNTCIAAVHEGHLIGTATALNHSDQVAWIGMVIVRKEFRSQGIGRALLTHIIDELKDFSSIKLDARPDGIPLYRSLGFADEFTVCRMAAASFSKPDIYKFKEKPVPADHGNIAEILSYDREVFGADRSYLLNALYSAYPEKAFCLYSGTRMCGYIFGREGNRYNYIGPSSAGSYETARILIASALESLDNQPVILDILNDREDTIRWLESQGFEKQCVYVRMYLKSNSYCGKVNDQYLISGPEFG